MESRDARAMGLTPFFPSRVAAEVAMDVATFGESAAAAAQREAAWLNVVDIVVVAVAAVVAMAAVAATCLEENVGVEYDEGPDAKAETPNR